MIFISADKNHTKRTKIRKKSKISMKLSLRTKIEVIHCLNNEHIFPDFTHG